LRKEVALKNRAGEVLYDMSFPPRNFKSKGEKNRANPAVKQTPEQKKNPFLSSKEKKPHLQRNADLR